MDRKLKFESRFSYLEASRVHSIDYIASQPSLSKWVMMRTYAQSVFLHFANMCKILDSKKIYNENV